MLFIVLGFISSKRGESFDQPQAVKEFIRFVIISIIIFVVLHSNSYGIRFYKFYA
jgi:hypothetical protein